MPGSNGYLDRSRDDDLLERVRTAGAISIPPNIFEQLYLAPKNDIHGKLRQTFGNPTPVGKQAQSQHDYSRRVLISVKHWAAFCSARRLSPWSSLSGRVPGALAALLMCE